MTKIKKIRKFKSNFVEVDDSIIKIDEWCFGMKDRGPVNLKKSLNFMQDNLGWQILEVKQNDYDDNDLSQEIKGKLFGIMTALPVPGVKAQHIKSQGVC